jgi:hypothetical protein
MVEVVVIIRAFGVVLTVFGSLPAEVNYWTVLSDATKTPVSFGKLTTEPCTLAPA